MKIVAITSCATGIAHSYMAAEALKKAAKDLGDSIHVEIQGALGPENPLSPNDIREADFVILAIDVNISGRDRFKGKPVLTVGPNAIIRDAKKIITNAKNSLATDQKERR